jgi:hypothetical protein
MKDNEILLNCTCSSIDHMIRISKDKDLDIFYLEVSLSLEKSLWKRLRSAATYLLRGSTCRYGSSAEIVLSKEQVEQDIIPFLQKHQDIS